jgi:myxalamid-type polyketide synthase MxaE and MxaD
MDRLIVWLRTAIAKNSNAPFELIGLDTPLATLGLSSQDGVALAEQLERTFGVSVNATLVYEHPTIRRIAVHVLGETVVRSDATATGLPADEPIAIIGIGCRFPGAASGPTAFINMLLSGGSGISEATSERRDWSATYGGRNAGSSESCTKWAGLLEGIDEFDPEFFGITAAEAERIDPQQRLVLEATVHASEDAGLRLQDLAGTSTGVFVGISHSDYGESQWNSNDLSVLIPTGSALSIAANRVSYIYDLRGPSLAVDSACSSSLTAVHLACSSLRTGEATMAFAGGVNVVLSPNLGIAFTQAGLMSPDGRCRPFDDRANGYVRSEGVGVVLLQPLSAAIAQGRAIYAVIKGSAVVQDGRSNGLMAPRGASQEEVIRKACNRAGIAPEDLDYVETHGTGTVLGDAIEAQALGATVGRNRKGVHCRVGSVKSNIGHLESAAGIAGLIKVAMCLRARTYAPNFDFKIPSSRIDFAKLGLEVVKDAQPWTSSGERRRAGVSSFGFGGTNVHVVLEELESAIAPSGASSPLILALSARDPEALRATAANFLGQLRENASDQGLLSAWIDGSIHRNTYSHRIALVGAEPGEIELKLTSYLNSDGAQSAVRPQHSQTALLFGGEGSMWPQAGRELFETEEVYRRALLSCDAVLRPHLKESILTIMFGSASEMRVRTDFEQSATFAMQVAFTELLRSWGVQPTVVGGYGVGEIAAAWAAGSLDLETAAMVVVTRAQCIAAVQGDTTLLLKANESETRRLLAELGVDVRITAVNGPRSVVVCGGTQEIVRMVAAADAVGIRTLQLPIEHAFQSLLMKEAAAQIAEKLKGVVVNQPSIPLFSVANRNEGVGALDADYWQRCLVEPLRFEPLVKSLASIASVIVEIGFDSALKSDIEDILAGENHTIVTTLVKNKNSRIEALRCASALFVNGALPDLAKLRPATASLAAPPYVWKKQTVWFEQAATKPVARRRSFLANAIEIATRPDEKIWLGRIETGGSPFLFDHVVLGFPVLPGAAFIDMALRITLDLYGLNGCLQDVKFHELLMLSPNVDVELQAIATAHAGNYQITLYARPAGGVQPWKIYASATAVTEHRAQQDSVAVDRIRSRCFDQYPKHLFYELLKGKNLNYGEQFRRVKSVHGVKGESIGELETDNLPKSIETYRMHPAILDAALQVSAAAFGARELSGAGGGFIPLSIQKIYVVQEDRIPTWSHARASVGQDGTRLVDIELLDKSGGIVAQIQGFALKPASAAASMEIGTQNALQNWLYGVDWLSATELPSANLAQCSTKRSICALLGTDDELLTGMASRMIELGYECISFSNSGQSKSRDGFYAVSNWQDINSFITSDEARSPSHVIRVLAEDSISLDAAGTGIDVIADLIAVIRAIETGKFGTTPRLTIVSRSGSTVRLGDKTAPGHAAIAGLLRAVLLEHPDLAAGVLDMEGEVNSRAVAERIIQYLSQDAEPYMAVRGDHLYIPRMMRRRISGSPPALNSGGIYIVTGGCGALGVEAAIGLIECGARRIVLVGRKSEPREDILQRIRASAKGESLDLGYVSCDVADCQQVHVLREKLLALGPIRGIVHAAGVLDDGSLLSMSKEKIARVMAPKSSAAIWLHQAFADQPLDHFVVFSSAAAILGSPGQSNYCAANAFLDGFVSARRAQGLPALSISWGAWSQLGMAADAETSKSLVARSRLVEMIAPEQGREVFKHLLGSNGQIMVFPTSLSALVQFYPSHAGLSLLSGIVAAKVHEVRGSRKTEQLYDRPDLAVEYVAPRTEIERAIVSIWQRAIGMAGIGVKDELFALGGDSVFASQILGLVNKKYGIQIHPEEAYELFTIEKLAEAVEIKLINLIDSMDEDEIAAALEQRETE